MNKTSIYLGIIVLGIFLLIGWIVIRSIRQTSSPSQQSSLTSTEPYFGKLKDIIAQNTSSKCTWKTNENNFGKGYLKNGRFYAEMTKDSQAGLIIIADYCLWSWQKDVKQGAKMCFKPEDSSSIWEKKGGIPDVDFTCNPSEFSENVFTPPNDIAFVNVIQ